MADGYEPVGAVTQQGAALSAQFGGIQPNNGLGYMQLQQQGQLARQGQQIDQQQMQQQANQFQQSQQMQREGLQFERDKLARLTASQKQAEDHERSMQDLKVKTQERMTNDRMKIEQELRAQEIEMAKAHGADREAKASRVAMLRQQRDAVVGKMNAYDAYSRAGKDGLLEVRKRVADTHLTLQKQKQAAADLGKTAAGIASRALVEDLVSANNEERRKYDAMLGKGGYGGASFEGDLGYNFLSPAEFGQQFIDVLNRGAAPESIGDYFERTYLGAQAFLGDAARPLIGNVPSDQLLKIDDAKINEYAQSRLSKIVAEGIAQATGGKIAVDDLRQALEGFIKAPGTMDPNKGLTGPQGPNDPMDAMQRLTALGVPPDVAKSAFMEVAYNLSGQNDKFETNKQALLKSLEGVPSDSPRYMATQASIKALERIQEEARIMGTHIDGLDIDGLQSTLTYLDKVASGAQIYDPSAIEGTIPDINTGNLPGGSELDDQLRVALRDRRLTDLSQFGPDAFRKLADLITPLQREKLDVENRMLTEDELKDVESQGTFDDLLEILRARTERGAPNQRQDPYRSLMRNTNPGSVPSGLLSPSIPGWSVLR